MPNFTDEIMAIAEVYAHGFLRIAKEKGSEDEVVAEFGDLISYMDGHADFERFITSATVDDDDRSASLEKLFRGKLSDVLLNLLLVLNERGRLEILRAVHRAVQMKVEAEHMQRRVLIETAMPLADDLKARVKEVMSRRLGKEALVDERVNPALIGGMVIHVGDERIDASLVQRVRAMSTRLSVRASHEVHRGDGKYIKES